MAKVELKKPVVEEIANSINGAASVVLVSYKGITVEQDTKMRKELREAGVTYKVYKNTMMNFAFKGTPCEELCQHLEGTNALAVCTEDATAPARILAKYAKDVLNLFQKLRHEKNFLENFLEASSLRLQTSLVCLTRLLNSRVAQQQNNVR